MQVFPDSSIIVYLIDCDGHKLGSGNLVFSKEIPLLLTKRHGLCVIKLFQISSFFAKCMSASEKVRKDTL